MRLRKQRREAMRTSHSPIPLYAPLVLAILALMAAQAGRKAFTQRHEASIRWGGTMQEDFTIRR